jgi:hypothetical protein
MNRENTQEARRFGGNSNWRGPIWFPVNYMLVRALQEFHSYYGDNFKVEHPTGSGKQMDLGMVAQDLSARLTNIFLRDPAHAAGEPFGATMTISRRIHTGATTSPSTNTSMATPAPGLAPATRPVGRRW